MTILNRRQPPTRRLALERLEDRSLLAVVVTPMESTQYLDEMPAAEICSTWDELEPDLTDDDGLDVVDAAANCLTDSDFTSSGDDALPDETGSDETPPEESSPEEFLSDKSSPDETPIDRTSSGDSIEEETGDPNDGDLSLLSEEVAHRGSEMNYSGFAPNGQAEPNGLPTSDASGAGSYGGTAPVVSETNRTPYRAGPVDLQRVFLEPVVERRAESSTPILSAATPENSTGNLPALRRTGGTPSLGAPLRPSLGMTRLMDGAASKSNLASHLPPATQPLVASISPRTAAASTAARVPRRVPEAAPSDRGTASPTRVRTYFVTRQDAPPAVRSVDVPVGSGTVPVAAPLAPTTEAIWKGRRVQTEPAERLPASTTTDRPANQPSSLRTRIVADADTNGSRQSM